MEAIVGFMLPPSPPESGGDSDNTLSENGRSSIAKPKDAGNSRPIQEPRSTRSRQESSAAKSSTSKRVSDDPQLNSVVKKAKGDVQEDSQKHKKNKESKTLVDAVPEEANHSTELCERALTPESEDEDATEYEVEEILDYWIEDGTPMYLIKWKNWSSDANTWEGRENLDNCDEALTKFFFTRVKEIKACMKANAGKPKKLAETLKNLPCPPDPRPAKEKLEYFCRSNSLPFPNYRQLEETFKENKKYRKRSQWPKAKLDQHLMDSVLGNLKSEYITPLKDNLVALLAECKYQENQAALKEWQADLNKVTKGMPQLTVVNDIDFTGPPKDFVYVNEYVAGKDVMIPNDPPIGCECKASCIKNKTTCCPAGNETDFPYSADRRLVLSARNAIFECNKKCKCDETCINRVVQNGTTALKDKHFIIFKTEKKGWGVKTMQAIKKGEFVAVYAGEVICSDEAEKRGRLYDRHGLTYLFDLDFNTRANPYTVDAKKMGNFSHFFNHCCDPNLQVYNVYVNCLDPNLPILALFARRDIAKGEELHFDYLSREQAATPKKKNYECHCNSKNCRKYFL